MTLSDIALLRRRIEALERSSDGQKDCFKSRLDTMRQRLAQLERTHSVDVTQENSVGTTATERHTNA